MKKVIILFALLALSVGTFSCGNGAGSANVPSGENPGIPTVVQLLPSHYIAQTNGAYIYLHAKVLDGNGNPIKDVPVTFAVTSTNLSSPPLLSATSANTDELGIATVTISSTSTSLGYATVSAQVNTGVSEIRDRKSVYFTINPVMAVSMSLEVDSVPGNGTLDASDYILFSPPPTPDDTVLILATVLDAGGFPVPGQSIQWFYDLTGDTVTFLAGTENITDENGEARAVVQVAPESIRNTETHLSIMAYAGNGAANMVTLFLEPVFVSSIAVSAKPQVIAPNGTSTITTIVILNTGAPAPDGTAVSFATAGCGTVEPFAQTTGGIAEAEFTAPSEVPAGNICTVTATAAGKSGSVPVTVRLALKVSPTSATICENSNACSAGTDTATFTITGGVPPYAFTSDNTAVISSSTVTGNSFTVNANNDSIGADTTVTLTITDSSDGVATATVKVIAE
jgi:hypothetical protein